CRARARHDRRPVGEHGGLVRHRARLGGTRSTGNRVCADRASRLARDDRRGCRQPRARRLHRRTQDSGDSLSEAQPLQRTGLRRLLVDTAPLRESRDFRRLWIGQGLSYVLGEVTYVALPYQIYKLTGSTFAVGAIALVELIPILSLTFIGGAAADALDRRRLLVVSEAGTTASVAGLVVNAAIPHPQVWACYVLAFTAAAFSSFGVGAARSLIPRLVSAEHVTNALALNSLYASLG